MKKLIAIDPGHGMNTGGKRTPKFSDGTFMQEREFNKAVANYLQPLLEQSGFDVLNVAESDTDVALATRTGLANNTIKNKFNRPADFYLSIHANAYGDGNSFNDANGVETFIYTNIKAGSQTEQYGQIVHKWLVKASGLKDRGLKRENFHVLRETNMSAALVECGFMTNLTEAKLLQTDAYRKKCAENFANAICEIYGVEYGTAKPSSIGTPIIGYISSVKAEQLKQWARNKKATDLFVQLADTFCEVAKATGINQVVAYCQSAKETGYGKFGGVLDDSYCNPCGMKNTEGGGDYDKSAHKKFNSWREGIQAQADHLALYAGAAGYPKKETPDPRHFAYLLGKCKTVEELGGNWAPSATYGEDIVKMTNEVMAIKVDNSVNEIDLLLDKMASKITFDRLYWKSVLEGNRIAEEEYLKILLERLVS